MKLDVSKLSDVDLEEYIKNNLSLFEEELLDKEDIKKKKKKMEHKNTKRIMRR